MVFRYLAAMSLGAGWATGVAAPAMAQTQTHAHAFAHALAASSLVLTEQLAAAIQPATIRFSLADLAPATAATAATPPPVEQPDPRFSDKATYRLKRPIEWRDVRKLEAAFQVLNIVDTLQTISCLQRRVCHEANPILGKRPGTMKLIGYKLASGALHVGITDLLIKHDQAMVKPWLYATVVVQGGVVGFNMRTMF